MINSSKIQEDKFRKYTDDTGTCSTDVLLVSNPLSDE